MVALQLEVHRPIIGISGLSASLPIIGIGHLTIGIGR